MYNLIQYQLEGNFTVKITNFEGPELYDVALWLENNKSKTIDKDILKEILKTINIAFVVEGINRIQSTFVPSGKL